MPRYAHSAGGSGEIIRTNSEITDWSTGNGGEAPKYAKSYPSDRITHRWPEPIEPPRYMNDAVPPLDSDSGAHFISVAGPTAAPGFDAPRGGFPLDQGVKQGIPNRNRFSRQVGRIGGGEGGSTKADRGVRYTDGEGLTKCRGKSG